MTEIENFLSDSQKFVYHKYKNKIPFKIVEFAQEIGVDVFRDNLHSNVSGQLEKHSNNTFSISVNKKNSATRDIFTIAHELGHYFRHQEYFKTHNIIEEREEKILFSTFAKDRINYSDEEKTREKEANDFAAELLMPEEIVKQKWQELNQSLSKMADYFNVSEIAMAFRIKNVIMSDFRFIA